MSEQITPNPSVPSQVVQEIKFPKFVNNLGIIPTSYKDSMSYYESLAWLCKFLEETVIPTVNENGNAVEELQALYIELNSYVTNYFANLNVQEEINNKLDDMVQSGEFQEALAIYFNSLETTYNERYQEMEDDYNERYNQLYLEQSSFERSVNSQLTSINNKVTSATSGSPAGTYATVSALTTADPNHSKIYLVLADGNWYYYNTSTSSWTAGGTYQSTGIGTNSVDFGNLSSRLQHGLNISVPSYTVIEGQYMNATGGLVNSEFYNRTSPILLKPNASIYTKATVTHSISVIAIINNDSEVTNGYSGTAGTDTAQTMYEYKNTTESYQYVTVSYQAGTPFELWLVDEDHLDYEVVLSNEDIYTNVTEDRYLKNDGTTGSLNLCDISDYIPVIDDFNYKLISTTSFNRLSDVRSFGFYDENKSFISGSHLPNSAYIDLEIPNNAKYLRFTITKSSEYQLLVETASFNKIINSEIIDVVTKNESVSNNCIGITDKAVFIGDSLTWGQTYTAERASYHNYYNYPYFVKKLLDINNITEIANKGATATSWWEAHENEIVDTNSIYFVWLGTNSILTNTVETDCAGDDYTQYANTETGKFGKILGKIKSLSGNKIVLLNIFRTRGTLSINNQVISDLAEKFDCILVDVYNSNVTETKYHKAYNGYTDTVHFNSTGHNFVANLVVNTMNNYVKENIDALEMYKVQT